MSASTARRGLPVRLAYLAIACVLWPLAARRRRRPLTLCYHGVTPGQAPRFRRQMAAVARRPHVRVTFDDAFANLLDNALPVTRARGIPVTIFAVSGRLGATPDWDIARDHPDARERTMSPDELRSALDAGGVTLGSHGLTHARLTAVSPARARAELAWSRAALELLADRPVDDFAFPHGAVNADLVAAARAAGYRRVHVLDRVPVVPDAPAGTVVERVGASPDQWAIEFRLTLDGAYAWLPPLRRAIRALRGGSRTSRAPEPIEADDSRSFPTDSDGCAVGIDRSGSSTCAEVAA